MHINAPIKLPDDLGGAWAALSFCPGQHQNDHVTTDLTVAFEPEDSCMSHLWGLKQNLAKRLARFLDRDEVERFVRGCPKAVVLGMPAGTTAIVSTTYNRSWELAYLLACFAAGGIGNWNDLVWDVWATGALDTNHGRFSADDLDEKAKYVLQRSGNVLFFGPWNAHAASWPSGKMALHVSTWEQLFENSLSPLSARQVAPERFSHDGIPQYLLKRSRTPETFETRVVCRDQLLELLETGKEEAIVIAEGIGWGKTSLLIEALKKHNRPVVVVDLDGVQTRKAALERLLDGIRLSYGDEDEIDADLTHGIRLFRNVIPRGTLLVFANCSANHDFEPSGDVIGLVEALATEGYRCIVELWDLEKWRPRFVRTCVAPRMPRLMDDEVRHWLIKHGVTDPAIVEAFDCYDGNPLGIQWAIEHVDRAKRDGRKVDTSYLLEQAVEWSSHPALSSYAERIENPPLGHLHLPRHVVEWIALLWPHELPARLADEASRQLEWGVRLGLLTVSDSGYRPRGLLHNFCLKRLLSEGGRLIGDWTEVKSFTAVATERLRRHLAEVANAAANPELRGELLTLMRQLPSSWEDLTAPAYSSPASPDAVSGLLSSQCLVDVRNQIWALEQVSRNEQSDEALPIWTALLGGEQRKNLIDALNRDWTALRALSRAYWYSSRQGIVPQGLPNNLLAVLQQVTMGGGGHRYHAARMALNVANDLVMSSPEAAESAMLFADRLLTELPDYPAWDYRNERRLDLMFTALRARYQATKTVTSAKQILRDICKIAATTLRSRPASVLWQWRCLWSLGEAIELLDDTEAVDLDAWQCLPNIEPALVAEFVISRTHILDEKAADREKVRARFASVVRNEWVHRRSHIQHPATALDFLTIECGLVLGEPQAAKAASRLLRDIWVKAETSYEAYPDDVLRLTRLCLRTESACTLPHELPRLLHQLPAARTGLFLNLASKRAGGDFWLGCLGYRIADFRRMLREQGMASDDGTGLGSGGTSRLRKSPLDRNRRDGDDHRRDIERAKYAVRASFGAAMRHVPEAAGRILASRYEFEKLVWQHALVTRRAGSKTAMADPQDLAAVIQEFNDRLPHEALTLLYSARYAQYVWRHEDAYKATEGLYRVAKSARLRREAMLLLARLLIMRVFTPEILQTRHTPAPPDEHTIRRLKAVVEDLTELWGDRHQELSVFSDGIEGGNEYWNAVVERVERRLPTPEEFWQTVSEAALAETSEDAAGAALTDLTDAEVMQLFSVGLRWASQNTDFDVQLRVTLAEAAFKCSWAAVCWTRGCTGVVRIDLKFNVAISIAIALTLNEDGRLLGRDMSPLTSRKGRPLSWRAAAAACLQSVGQRAVGAFAEHVRELSQRFRAVL